LPGVAAHVGATPLCRRKPATVCNRRVLTATERRRYNASAPLALRASLASAEFRQHLLESRIDPEPVPNRIEAQFVRRDSGRGLQ
jgi:hypothetical protein